jgi:hypothetical protein
MSKNQSQLVKARLCSEAIDDEKWIVESNREFWTAKANPTEEEREKASSSTGRKLIPHREKNRRMISEKCIDLDNLILHDVSWQQSGDFGDTDDRRLCDVNNHSAHTCSHK